MENGNGKFTAFLNEADFTKELLAIGVTQLGKANYAAKGRYYQAFSCLSVGLERMEKLCLVLDYYVANNGAFPPERYIRENGHNIASLFEKCREIAEKRGFRFYFSFDYKNIHREIISVLTDFSASSGRYANLNALTENSSDSFEKDCARKWYEKVDIKLYAAEVSERQKRKIETAARAAKQRMESYTDVYHFTEAGKLLTEIEEGSFRTGIFEAVAKYRRLYMLQIIRYLTELIEMLGHKASGVKGNEIPLFSEIFGLFYNEDEAITHE